MKHIKQYSLISNWELDKVNSQIVYLRYRTYMVTVKTYTSRTPPSNIRISQLKRGRHFLIAIVPRIYLFKVVVVVVANFTIVA